MKRAQLPLSRRLLAAVLIAGSALVQIAPAQRVPGVTLTAVRFWSFGDVTRVAIETSGEAQFRSERIEGPDRLFFDLPGVRRRPGTRGLQTIRVGDKLLKQIRIAETEPGTTRVVLDLAVPADFAVSQLANPDRLMIELRAASQPAPLPTTAPAGPLETERPPVAQPIATHSVTRTPERTFQPPDAYAAPDRGKPASLPAPPAVTAQPPVVANPVARTPAPAPVPPPPEQRAALEPPAARQSVAGSARQAAPATREKAEPKGPTPAALAAKSDSHGNRSLIRALGLKLERVVIDPGHGGHDTGTIGRGGLQEKDLVLDVAKRLGALVAQRLGSEVIFTRTDDTFVPLEERTEIANQNKADLFLSIHANSSRQPAVAGAETFYLNFTTSASALDVAARENATSQKSIYELQELVQKIALKEKVQESRELAETMQKAIYTSLWRGRVKDRGVKKAPFVVLIGANMPSVLAEIDFLSNPRQERLLKRNDYKQRVAEALYKGVAQYQSALSHYQVAQQTKAQ